MDGPSALCDWFAKTPKIERGKNTGIIETLVLKLILKE
jgi:hypothetical protein